MKRSSYFFLKSSILCTHHVACLKVLHTVCDIFQRINVGTKVGDIDIMPHISCTISFLDMQRNKYEMVAQ